MLNTSCNFKSFDVRQLRRVREMILSGSCRMCLCCRRAPGGSALLTSQWRSQAGLQGSTRHLEQGLSGKELNSFWKIWLLNGSLLLAMCFLHGWIHWMCNNNWVSSQGWSPFGDLSAVTCQDGFFHKCTFFKFACLLSIPRLSKGQHVNFLHSYIWLLLKIRLLWFSEVCLMGKAFWQLLPL